MIRKFVGASLLLAAIALSACGGSSSTTNDECDDNPSAPTCAEAEEENPVVE